MKNCIDCKNEIPWYIWQDGKRYCLSSRKRCTNCFPLLSRYKTLRVYKKNFKFDQIAPEIQQDIEKLLTWREISVKYNISLSALSRLSREKKIKFLTKNEKLEKGYKFVSHPQTPESKKKISEARKKFLAANPDKVPYLLNHSSKPSYPEIYFENVFAQEKFEVVKKHRVGTFQLDFAIIEYKIDIEIDGDQHNLDLRIVEHDKKRTSTLESLGWKCFRILWSEYQKKNFEEKSKFVREFIEKIKETCRIIPILTA